mgnify:CR=1 FL=1
MKEKMEKISTVVRNFWAMMLAISMVGLAVYNLYQVRANLTAIGVQVVIAVFAAIVVVEGVIQLIKFLSRR